MRVRIWELVQVNDTARTLMIDTQGGKIQECDRKHHHSRQVNGREGLKEADRMAEDKEYQLQEIKCPDSPNMCILPNSYHLHHCGLF